MKVLIAGGGTAGHINPGIALAKYIKYKNPDATILFAGTQKGLESSIVPKEGFDIKFIRVSGFKRKLSLNTFESMKDLVKGLLESRSLIKTFRPDIVIGTGGYVCGPVLLNASLMGIPSVIHEQNVLPGITNKILAKFVDGVAVSFEEAKKYFKSAKKIAVTGNPVRESIIKANPIKARQNINIPNDIKLITIFGGSRGAKGINLAVCDMIKNYYKEDFHIYFATGTVHYEEVKECIANKLHSSNISVVPYIYDMENVLAASDLAVTRAGAITIAELTTLGLPSILIPSPCVAANHQEYNARMLEKNNAADLILEKDLNGEILYNKINELLSDTNKYQTIKRNCKLVNHQNSTNELYEFCISHIKNIEKGD